MMRLGVPAYPVLFYEVIVLWLFIFSEWSENLSAEGGTGKYFNDYCQWRRVPEFVDFVYNSGVSASIGKLLDSEVCRSVINIHPIYHSAIATYDYMYQL